ncbi:MAG TPA: hypothetical protein VFW50_17920 [Streptosporangiaceae bacterium]|nr:hypothetical protein [Streptosporangiaceae bacterium]
MARPTSHQSGGNHDGDVRGAVLFRWLVAGSRNTALAGGFDGDEREPSHVVDGREVGEQFGRDPTRRQAAGKPRQRFRP